MVPNGWEVKKLGELCSLNPKKPSKPDDGVVSFIAMPQLSESGKVISTKKKPYDEVSKGFSSFVDKDVLVAKITPCFENGKGALVDNLENGMGFGSTEFHVLRAKKGTHPEFIYYLTRTKELRVKGEMNMQGSAGHRRVTADYFNAYKVVTPPYSEQRKIAKILSTWDKAINTTEKLITTSKQQKKALMQQLLTGKKRLVNPETGKAFEGEWNSQPISSLITESRIAGTNGELARKLTVKLYGRGVTQKEEKRLGSSSTKYYKRKSGQFIYSKLDFLNGAFGIIPEHLDGFESTLDLPAFDFSEQVEPKWFIEFVSRDDFYTSNLGLANGGRKARRVNPKDLLQIKVQVPSLKEQQKIASALTAADNEIEVHEVKLAHFKQEKKALMQQLLTGKKRVVI